VTAIATIASPSSAAASRCMAVAECHIPIPSPGFPVLLRPL
jgi:hypothetical protein